MEEKEGNDDNATLITLSQIARPLLYLLYLKSICVCMYKLVCDQFHKYCDILPQEDCITCSQCPMNKIIISPCQGLHDTRCGPFYDFRGSLPAEPSDDEVEVQKDSSESSNQHGKHADSSKSKSVDSFDRSSNLLHTSSDNAAFSDSEWKSLTLALIVLVSVVFVLVVTFVIFFLRRNFMNKTKIVCEYSSPPENV